MDKAMFVTLLLLGVCAPSLSTQGFYFFINERKTWDAAQEYCVQTYTEMAEILSVDDLQVLMDMMAEVYTDQAWIGLRENVLDLSWVSGGTSSFSNWYPDEPSRDSFCVTMTVDGYWTSDSCSARRAFVCRGGDGGLFVVEDRVTWDKAEAACKNQQGLLATIGTSQENEEVMRIMSVDDEEVAWIGLSGSKNWSWSESGVGLSFLNWQPGQPDLLSGADSCGAVELLNGTWTDEECSLQLPFFCYGTDEPVSEQKQTVLRMEIKSRADMEAPAHSATLQRQLHAELTKQGVTDFKLAWKKPPVKQPEEISEDERCLVKH